MVRYAECLPPFPVAHRGGAGLAPENTRAAFDRSYALGVRFLETDVRTTSDGVCVAFHDARLQRVTGRPGRLADHSWSSVQRLRVAGEPVPRLEELFETFPDAFFVLDLKEPRSLPSLVAAVTGCRATDRICLTGTGDRVLAAFRTRLGPAVATALGWESLAGLARSACVGTRPRPPCDAQFAHMPARLAGSALLGRRVIERAHGLGLHVLAWTVNDPDVMHRLLDDGVDGLITDRPDLLREVLVARDAWRSVPAGRSPTGAAPAQDVAMLRRTP